MSDPTKIRPEWRLDKSLINLIRTDAAQKHCTQEELVSNYLFAEISANYKGLTEFERNILMKNKLNFDIKMLVHTVKMTENDEIYSNIVSSLCESDRFLMDFEGNLVKKSYLFTVFSKFDDLQFIDRNQYRKVLSYIKKQPKINKIYKEYLNKLTQ